MNERPECRSPWKIPYRCRADALAHVADLKLNKRGNKKLLNRLCAYPCVDHWHVGHDRYKRVPMES